VSCAASGSKRGLVFGTDVACCSPNAPTRMTQAQPTPAARLRILLVSDGGRGEGVLREGLQTLGHEVVAVLSSGSGVLEAVEGLRPDAVLVECVCPSQDLLDSLARLRDVAARPVVVFAQEGAEGPMRQALAAGASAYVVAGLHAQRVGPVLRVAMTRFEQELRLRAELAQARLLLEQRKVIERAKGLLMQRHSLAEEQAYEMLRKAAMDKGLKLAELAQRLLDAAHVLG
jgi:two-component system, response regulator / RNA-binding antiterminator